MAEVINIRIPDSADFSVKDLDEKAAKFNLSRSAFILKGIELMMGFDEDFILRINKYAKGLNIPEWLVIQNMLIERFAEDAAEFEVWGPRQKILDEFMFIRKGDQVRTVTGGELFNIIKNNRVKELELERVKHLKEIENHISLEGKDKEFMIKMRQGQAWHESEEHKREQEQKKEAVEFIEKLKKGGQIDSSVQINNGLITLTASLVDAIKKGLPRDAAIEQFKSILNEMNDKLD